MTWRRIQYGTVVLTGLAVTGTLIWWSNRHTIEFIDVLEVWQGMTERVLATQIAPGPLQTVTSALVTVSWSGFGSDTNLPGYWVYSGTNQWWTNLLVGAVATNSYVWTQNLAQVRVALPSFFRRYRDASVGRQLWGGCSNAVASGFAAPYDGLNGTYVFCYSTQTEDFVVAPNGVLIGAPGAYWGGVPEVQYRCDVYTNGTDCALGDFGCLLGHVYVGWDAQDSYHSRILTGPAGALATKRCDPACGPWGIASVGPTFDIVPGGLTFSACAGCDWRDAPAHEEDVVHVGLDRHVRKSIFHAMDVPIMALAAGWDPVYGSDYLDATMASGGAFLGYSNALPLMNRTSLWVRLGIGTVTGYQARFTSGYPIVSNAIEIADLTERYRVLNALEWTRRGGLTWTNGGGANVYQWATPAAGYPTWSEAMGACTVLTVSSSASNVAPYAGTTGTWQDLSNMWFRAYAYASRCKAISDGLQTAVQHRVQWYSKARPWSVSLNAGSVFNSAGTGLSNGVFQTWEESADAWDGTVFSGWLGDVALPDWCAAPGPATTRTDRGWELVESDAVVKWRFLYCTNSVP